MRGRRLSSLRQLARFREPNQFRCLQAQRSRDGRQRRQRCRVLAALDQADVVSVQVRRFRESFLRKPTLQASLPDDRTNC